MLTYETYDKKRLAVHGDKELYGKDMINLGCRWNPRLKGGSGWYLPIEKEPQLLEIIAIHQQKDAQLEAMENRFKSRKEQEKFHRETSDHDSSDEDDVEPNDMKMIHQLIQENNNSESELESVSNSKTKQAVSENEESKDEESEDEDSEDEESENEDSEESEKSEGEESKDADPEQLVLQLLEATKETSRETPKLKKNKETPKETPRETPKLKKNKETPRETPRETPMETPRETPQEKHRKLYKNNSKIRDEKSSNSELKNRILQLQMEKDIRRGKSGASERRNKALMKNPVKYYKEFSKKPKEFKKMYATSSDDSLSSSEDESESSDDFPSPNSPKRGNKKQTHKVKDELYNKLQKLQQRLYEMEIENKKLRTYINKR